MRLTSYPLDPASPRPRYLQLADDLRRQIENGTLKPGDQVMPELALAQRYSLARGTVRQALQLLVNQGLLQRTRRKGTFVAAGSPTRQTALISFVVPYLRDALTLGILHGIESVLRLNGYGLIVGHTDSSLAVEAEHLKRLRQNQISGLILFPVALPGEAELLAEALPPGFPIVLIDRTIPGLKAGCVLADNYGGAYRAVEHLIALGHRRIACISHTGEISCLAERVRGYEQALRDAHLAPIAPIVLQWREPSHEGQPADYSGEAMAPIDRLLQAPDAPTAFFCVNDFIALSLLRHALGGGRRVPEQIAIIGFDDIPLVSFVPVPLTTVAQPKFEIGVQAALLLLEQIAGSETAKRTVVLPTALAVRASTVAQPPSGVPQALSKRDLALAAA